MNKESNIDLSKVLKGHEGETFYTPLYGNVTLVKIMEGCYYTLQFSIGERLLINFTLDGKYSDNNTECLIFPSKDQRDWNKWIEEQKPRVPKFKIGQFVRSKRSGKIYEIVDNSDIYNYSLKETPCTLPEYDLEDVTPKTWSEYINCPKCEITSTVSLSLNGNDYLENDSAIEKSALALLKIHQLIEVGYGGNITNDEWNNPKISKYVVICRGKIIEEIICALQREAIAFHTEEQRREFLKYPENIRLVKDYYMIP